MESAPTESHCRTTTAVQKAIVCRTDPSLRTAAGFGVENGVRRRLAPVAGPQLATRQYLTREERRQYLQEYAWAAPSP